MQFLKQNETKSPQQSEELTFEAKKPTADLRDWPQHCSNCVCLPRENETLFSDMENNEWLLPSCPVMCSTCLRSFLSSVRIPHPSPAEGAASLEGCYWHHPSPHLALNSLDSSFHQPVYLLWAHSSLQLWFWKWASKCLLLCKAVNTSSSSTAFCLMEMPRLIIQSCDWVRFPSSKDLPD